MSALCARRDAFQAGQGPWYLRVPEWLLQLLMPVAASQLLRKVYHPHTFQTKPQLIRTAWLSLVSVKPWVMQAQCPQVGAVWQCLASSGSAARASRD